ncbi:hypothetical protein Glove_351g27 [Diversispora epigaea]|uniref:Uncharacterized protein n=1 Tax=Diversispora epigaea TaxID=1348612 RepID=A0A397HGF0_9GLOM|nr:hypothetical protein Glove_351g27 [Diversispora epigaea]
MDFPHRYTIREYGAINRYTTKTYESLHKSYVKTPYRLSNKKGIEKQIMKTIRRKAIIKRRVTEELHETPTALIYTSKLFEFKLLEASIFFEQQKKNLDLTENMIKGFAKFLKCLDSFFDMLDIISAEGCRIKIFGSVTLKNINILRATNKFQNRPWFTLDVRFMHICAINRIPIFVHSTSVSNIAIAMDDAELFEYQSDNGTCYAQTLLITEVILPNKSPFHLALVQWYDFKSKKTPFVYDCPLLKLVEIYNFIEIEAIEEIVHIVPRFDTKDEYFDVRFMHICAINRIPIFVHSTSVSNIAIAMDDAELFEYQSDNGTCYAQTLLITEVILPNKSPFHLALVQWYDFKSKKTPFVYDCPLLKLVEIYNFIEIEAIEEIVHIVPRFDTKDEYFVNKFIF